MWNVVTDLNLSPEFHFWGIFIFEKLNYTEEQGWKIITILTLSNKNNKNSTKTYNTIGGEDEWVINYMIY